MSDVIRLSKKQKESIEKIIPALLSRLRHYKNVIPELESLYDDYIKYVDDRDYSVILSWLINLAAHDLKLI